MKHHADQNIAVYRSFVRRNFACRRKYRRAMMQIEKYNAAGITKRNFHLYNHLLVSHLN
jgi:hypothetical protein